MRRPDLIADCSNCAALCCVAPSFDTSEDFAIDKAAGAHCPHETVEHRCAIHAEREALGFSGCVIYECYGAGPHATRRFAGSSGLDAERNEVFLVLRVVHELLWQLTEAVKLIPNATPEVLAQIASAVAALDAVAHEPTASLLAADLCPHQAAARAALQRVAQALSSERLPKRHLPVLPDATLRTRPHESPVARTHACAPHDTRE